MGDMEVIGEIWGSIRRTSLLILFPVIPHIYLPRDFMGSTPGGRRDQRTAFLRELYQRVDASVAVFVNGFEIGEELGIGRDEAGKLFDYFEEKGFIKVDDHRSGTLRITALGIDEVEATG